MQNSIFVFYCTKTIYYDRLTWQVVNIKTLAFFIILYVSKKSYKLTVLKPKEIFINIPYHLKN